MPYNALERMSDGYVVQFARLVGEIGLPGQKVKKVEEEYVSGAAFKLTRWKAEPKVYTGVAYAADDLALASTLVDYSSMEGTQCIYYNHAGLYLQGVVVISAEVVKTKLLEYLVFEGTPYLNPWKITSQWVLEYPYGYY